MFDYTTLHRLPHIPLPHNNMLVFALYSASLTLPLWCAMAYWRRSRRRARRSKTVATEEVLAPHPAVIGGIADENSILQQMIDAANFDTYFDAVEKLSMSAFMDTPAVSQTILE